MFLPRMNASSVGGTLLPSYAHGMALRGAQAGATDTVTAHFNFTTCPQKRQLQCL